MQEYVQQELDRKNRRIYFKQGRWLIHVLIWFIIYFFGFNSGQGHFFSLQNLFYNLVWDNWIFALFFYTFCLYLIPVYFKRNRQAAFWLLLAGSLCFFSFAELCFQAGLERYIPRPYRTGWQFSPRWYWHMLYGRYFVNFVILSIFPFLMEVVEGLRTHTAISSETEARIATEQQLLKTRMDPGFLLRALDGITALADDRSPSTAPSVVLFSDVLRYRLYHREGAVALEKEIRHLRQLFDFQRGIGGGECNLEINGDISGKTIAPLTLINLAEALLSTGDGRADWSLLLYLLAEPTVLQIAAELHTHLPEAEAHIEGATAALNGILGAACTFTVVREAENFSISVCIPTPPASAA